MNIPFQQSVLLACRPSSPDLPLYSALTPEAVVKEECIYEDGQPPTAAWSDRESSRQLPNDEGLQTSASSPERPVLVRRRSKEEGRILSV